MALQLKIVTLVLERLSSRAPDAIACVISDFLVSDFPLSKAIALSAAESVALVDFVWLRSLRAAESSRWTVAKLLQSDANYYQLQFFLALVQAVRRTDLSLVQWVLRHFSACPVNKQVIEEAARGGHLWALQLLEEDSSHAGIEWGDESLIEAAREGHWHVVHWLHQRVGSPPQDVFSLTETVADYALSQNNLEQLKWAMAHWFVISEVGLWRGATCSVLGDGALPLVGEALDLAIFIGVGTGTSCEVGRLGVHPVATYALHN